MKSISLNIKNCFLVYETNIFVSIYFLLSSNFVNRSLFFSLFFFWVIFMSFLSVSNNPQRFFLFWSDQQLNCQNNNILVEIGLTQSVELQNDGWYHTSIIFSISFFTDYFRNPAHIHSKRWRAIHKKGGRMSSHPQIFILLGDYEKQMSYAGSRCQWCSMFWNLSAVTPFKSLIKAISFSICHILSKMFIRLGDFTTYNDKDIKLLDNFLIRPFTNRWTKWKQRWKENWTLWGNM